MYSWLLIYGFISVIQNTVVVTANGTGTGGFGEAAENSATTLDCQKPFPQWIGFVENFNAGTMLPQIKEFQDDDNDGITRVGQSPAHSCSIRLTAFQFPLQPGGGVIPSITVVETTTGNMVNTQYRSSSPKVFFKLAVLQIITQMIKITSSMTEFYEAYRGDYLVTYQPINHLTHMIGNHFDFLFDESLVSIPVKEDETEYKYYGDSGQQILQGLLVINYRLSSLYILADSWTDYGECEPLEDFSGPGTKASRRECRHYESPDIVDMDLCEDEAYHLIECEIYPEWREEGAWSDCEALDDAPCGIGSKTAEYMLCFDNITNEQLNETLCGEKVYLNAECYKPCADDYFWNEEMWQPHVPCTPYLADEQGTPPTDYANYDLSSGGPPPSESCGNGFESYIPTCQLANGLTGENETVSNEICSEIPQPPINTFSCYQICSDFTEKVCAGQFSPILPPPTQVVEAFIEEDYLGGSFEMYANMISGDYVSDSTAAPGEVIITSPNGGHFDMVLEFNKFIAVSTFSVAYAVSVTATEDLKLRLMYDNIEDEISLSGMTPNAAAMTEPLYQPNIMISSLRLYTEGIAPPSAMTYTFTIDVTKRCEFGQWGQWGNWSVCEGNCTNGGTWSRTRDCFIDDEFEDQVDRRHCVGKFMDFAPCNCLELYKWDPQSGKYGECEPLDDDLPCGNGIQFKEADICTYNMTSYEMYYPHLCREKPISAKNCFAICNDTCSLFIEENPTREMVLSVTPEIPKLGFQEISDVKIMSENLEFEDYIIDTMQIKTVTDWCIASPYEHVDCTKITTELHTKKYFELYEDTGMVIGNIQANKSYSSGPYFVANGTLRFKDFSTIAGNSRQFRFREINGCGMPKWSTTKWVANISECTAYCDNGTQINGTLEWTRPCVTATLNGKILMEYPAHYCMGEAPVKNESCQPQETCFAYSNFTDWSNCTQGYCGDFGLQNRTRTCMGMYNMTVDECQSVNCSHLGEDLETKRCYREDNPCYRWGDWSEWSKECGNTTRTKTRECFIDIPGDTTIEEAYLQSIRNHNGHHELPKWYAHLAEWLGIPTTGDSSGNPGERNQTYNIYLNLSSLDWLQRLTNSEYEQFEWSNCSKTELSVECNLYQYLFAKIELEERWERVNNEECTVFYNNFDDLMFDMEEEFAATGIDCYNVTKYEDLGCQDICGNTTRLFSRNCTYFYNDTIVDYGNCSHYGPQNYTEFCSQEPCYSVTEYKDLGCQDVCGNTTRLFSRDCTYFLDDSIVDYQNCSHYGPQNYTEFCSQDPCYTPTEFVGQACDKPCGGGKKNFTRECLYYDGVPHDWSNCAEHGNSWKTKNCNTHSCNGYSEWSSWSAECSRDCNGGIKFRERDCLLDNKADCVWLYDEKDCNMHPCPEAGYWLNWTSYSVCSVTCGVGLIKSTRLYVEPRNGGNHTADYKGNKTDVRTLPCDTEIPCPGPVLTTADLPTCNDACESKFLKCSSKISNPNTTIDFVNVGINTCSDTIDENSPYRKPYDPHYDSVNGICHGFVGDGFYDCSEPSEDPDALFRICNCVNPDELIAGEWSMWGECSTTCGPGVQTRSRENQHIHGDVADNEQLCEVVSCPVNGGWSDWTGYSACSEKCGPGISYRERFCDNPLPSYGGMDCYGENMDIVQCTLAAICPTHGGWTIWSDKTACDKSCGGGLSKRWRSCTNPTPEFGGDLCKGDAYEETACNDHDCMPVKLGVFCEFVDEDYKPEYTDNLDSLVTKNFIKEVEAEISIVYGNNLEDIENPENVNFNVDVHSFEEGDGTGVGMQVTNKN